MMDTYCVIQFKDKEEKKQVLTLLMETEAEYKVTTDLKKFVAEKFNVTIIDNVPMLPPFAPFPIFSEQSSSTANGAYTQFVNGQYPFGPEPMLYNAGISATMSSENANGSQIVTPPASSDQSSSSSSTTPHGSIERQLAPVQASNFSTDQVFDGNSPIIEIQPEHLPTASEPVDIGSFDSAPQNPVTVPSSTPNQVYPAIPNTIMDGTDVPYLERPTTEPKEEIVEDVRNVEEPEGEQRNMEAQVGDDGQEEQEAADVNGFLENEVANVPEVNELRNNVRDMDEQDEETGQEDEEEIGDVDDALVENDNPDGISDDDELMPNQVDVPSSSNPRRSGRTIKRTNCEMNNDNDKQDTPCESKKKCVQEMEEVDESKCKTCGTSVKNKYPKKLEHAMKHIDLERFECMVDNCGYKHKYRSRVQQHSRVEHPSRPYRIREIRLTQEQLDQIMNECFETPKNNDIDNCQLCQHSVGGKLTKSLLKKQNHSLNHVDFMLFKCKQSGCLFESKTEKIMNYHHSAIHRNMERSTSSKIELTKEQKLEIENTFAKCYPNLNQNGNAP